MVGLIQQKLNVAVAKLAARPFVVAKNLVSDVQIIAIARVIVKIRLTA